MRLLAVTDADPRRAGDAPDRRVALPHARGREPNDLLLVLDTYPDDSADLVEVECVDARGMRETERLTLRCSSFTPRRSGAEAAVG